MELPKSQWSTLTSCERKKLARLTMKMLLPIFGALTLLGVTLLILTT